MKANNLFFVYTCLVKQIREISELLPKWKTPAMQLAHNNLFAQTKIITRSIERDYRDQISEGEEIFWTQSEQFYNLAMALYNCHDAEKILKGANMLTMLLENPQSKFVLYEISSEESKILDKIISLDSEKRREFDNYVEKL